MPEYSYRHPGPGYDGQAEMVRWFSYWLKDDDQYSDIINEPDITLFMRTSLTTGNYRYESQWPIAGQQIRRMFISSEQRLPENVDEKEKDSIAIDTLEYRPWIGFEAGDSWGISLKDQRLFDEHCLVYDSSPVNASIEIAGFVNVSLQVKHHTNWPFPIACIIVGQCYCSSSPLDCTS